MVDSLFALLPDASGFFGFMAFMASETLLFAAIWFLIGALDDVAVDLIWLWQKLTGRGVAQIDALDWPAKTAVDAPIAIFIPAWREAGVIGHMIRHCRQRWDQEDFRLYLGSYINDPATYQAALTASEGDPRIRLIVHERHGPTSKADCLNRLWQAMVDDEQSSGVRCQAVMLHDAEDLVHADALRTIKPLIGPYDFVQLPVIPLQHPNSLWVSGHYCDEFAEAHGKAMVVRNRLAVGLPAAGVGCAFSRHIMQSLAETRNDGSTDMPFAADSVTEDYELGLNIHQMKGRGLFLRQRDAQGEWIGTRAFFPSNLTAAIRQKSRWMTGISLAGWDRMGWAGNLGEHWMRLRDRRAILAALVLSCAYLALVLGAVLAVGHAFGLWNPAPLSPLLIILLKINLGFLLWRLAMRFAFTAAQHGFLQGLVSVPRMFVGNIIAILAARRALFAYIASLFGKDLTWDKTDHSIIPFENGIGHASQSVTSNG